MTRPTAQSGFSRRACSLFLDHPRCPHDFLCGQPGIWSDRLEAARAARPKIVYMQILHVEPGDPDTDSLGADSDSPSNANVSESARAASSSQSRFRMFSTWFSRRPERRLERAVAWAQLTFRPQSRRRDGYCSRAHERVNEPWKPEIAGVRRRCRLDCGLWSML